MSMEDGDPANGPLMVLAPYVERELLATIDGLGELIDTDSSSVYTKGEDCVGTISNLESYVLSNRLILEECLSDLLRCLRREDKDTRIFTFYLGKWRVVSQNLIPLLKTYKHEQPIVNAVGKLVLIFSMPLS